MTENRELIARPKTVRPIGSAKCRSAQSAISRIADHLALGAGGLFAVNFVPDALAARYGGHNPTGAMAFIRLKLN